MPNDWLTSILLLSTSFEPQTADQTLFQTRRLRQAIAFQAISVDERLAQANATKWFGDLADQAKYGFYRPVRHQHP